MKRTLVLIACGAVLAGVSVAVPGAALAATGPVAIPGTHPAWATGRTPMVASAGDSRLSFDVYLKLRDETAAEALASTMSNPSDPAYAHYLTPAQVRGRFAATEATVASVRAWLRSAGLTVGATAPNRAYVEASGTVSRIEQAFGVHLNSYTVHGRRLHAPDADLKVPRSIAGAVMTVTGLTQSYAVPAHTPAANPGVVAPPAGFRNAQPCASYYGQKVDTVDPPYNGQHVPYVVCGYKPGQLRSAYGLSSANQAGITGAGQTVAIVDAFGSPTIYQDAAEYAARNDPSYPLSSSQFSQQVAPPSGYEGPGACGAAGWYAEQALDVEAVHAIAPGADIRYVGAADCSDASLDAALNTVVAGHLADIVTNSYLNLGEETVPAGDIQAFNEIAVQAALEGITVTFASGDDGDDAAVTGTAQANFSADSPWVTAVGGTTLGVSADGQRVLETGWETGISKLVDGAWSADEYDYGAGGGTSRIYSEPSYQQGVVPSALAQQNQIGSSLGRVVPDISMDADPNTGMLIGMTQTFPDGVYYDQYRIGGTSLASPLFAGVVALDNQFDGYEHGFLNPLLYSLTPQSGPIDDVRHVDGAVVRVDYADSVDAGNGYLYSVRTFDDTATQVIHTTPGYDDVTGLGTPYGLLAAPPTESITTPVANESYPVGSVPDAAFTCTAGRGGTLAVGLAGCSASIDGGSAVASGTPLAGSLGPHAITVTATDTDGQHTSTTLHYSVAEPPVITSADHTTFTALRADTFQVTTIGGYPAGPITFTETGALPAGVTLSSTGLLSGMPTVEDSGSWPITITASNGQAAATQAFLLTVRAPRIHVPAHAPASAGLIQGVALRTLPGQTVTWQSSGFAPGAPVTVLAYPALTYAHPVVLGYFTANKAGDVTMTVHIPATLSGMQYIVAGGYRLDGHVLYLTGQTDVAPI